MFAWLLFSAPLANNEPRLNAMAAVAALMAVWWMTEAIPLAATALIPLALFPLLKIATPGETAASYGDRMIYLFLGGFLVALAIEESGLHRRVALHIVKVMGDNPRQIVLGFMLATGLLSMWLSNTATTLMLLPIASSVLLQADKAREAQGGAPHGFGVAVMLGIAYASSVGGMSTLIGTPPNIFFRAYYTKTYPDAPEITFGGWMLLGVPLALAFGFVIWRVLILTFRVEKGSILGGRSVIADELVALGKMKPAEWRMAGVFTATALLWIFREPVAGWGWAPALGLEGLRHNLPPSGAVETLGGLHAVGGLMVAGTPFSWVDDSTVAIAMAVLCFILPSGGGNPRPLLTWSATARVPWGILLLFGGGMALATGMEASGLSQYLGDGLAAAIEDLPAWGMAAAMSSGMTWLTELTSNLASVQMILPILSGAADHLNVAPTILMIPATLAASCAFMLPVATPPNAIVYASGRISMRDMVKAGIVLNLLTTVLVTVAVLVLGRFGGG